MTRVLLLLCAILIAVNAAELRSSSEAGILNRAEQAVRVRLASRLVVHATDADRSDKAWVDLILARPVFAPDRRPAQPATAAVVRRAIPRLAGIIKSSEEALAIFQARGEKTTAARIGEAVEGWQIKTITVDEVGLQKANERISLRPQFDSAEGRHAVETARARPPSRWEVAAPRGLLRARWSNPQLQP